MRGLDSERGRQRVRHCKTERKGLEGESEKNREVRQTVCGKQ